MKFMIRLRPIYHARQGVLGIVNKFLSESDGLTVTYSD